MLLPIQVIGTIVCIAAVALLVMPWLLPLIEKYEDWVRTKTQNW